MINPETLQKLQFNRIIDNVQKRAIGEFSKQKIATLPIENNLATVKTKQQETKEARLIIDSGQHVPFMGLQQINRLMEEVQKGIVLTPSELIEFADFLRSNRMIKKFFDKNQYQTPLLYKYSQSLTDFVEIEEAIYQKIQGNRVADEASKGLRKARKQLKSTEDEIETKLLKFLHHASNKTMIQDALVVRKEGHFTVPIKASFKNKIAGSIIDQSNNGQTYFIEPETIAKLNEQATMLKATVEAEEYQILAELTGNLNEQELNIMNGIDAVTMFDIIFARGKYSREYDGITPKMNQNEQINLVQGKHPFLPKDAVPLDFQLGMQYRGLVITGANAGGKTLVLKTVGLLSLMAMFGLQIPAGSGTELAVFNDILVDIGDQQSLDNALSTFSGHMKNIAEILKNVGRNTLILLDEIGSGTEPNEGAGLAIAIMETMYQKGALVVATTHYGEIKKFAEQHEDFTPAAMQFDRETLTPRYVLKVGEVGDSQALWIAHKMQMDKRLIQKADQYIKVKNYPTSKKEFETVVKPSVARMTIVEPAQRYHQGDRVLLTENQKVGLVFADAGQNEVEVFIDHQMQMISRKRLEIKAHAEDLYPRDYDFNSLFVDFQTRKMNKDLDRGSKKAQKQLDQMARNRR